MLYRSYILQIIDIDTIKYFVSLLKCLICVALGENSKIVAAAHINYSDSHLGIVYL